MLDQKVKILSENLARSINRRKFLKQTGGTIFAGMTVLAAGHLMGGKGFAAEKPTASEPPQCAPPGPYCNLNGVNEPNGCRGGSCYQHRFNNEITQCRVMYGWYQAGCWTTNIGGGSYWVCCDCECFDSIGTRRLCGCAQLNTQPVPRPDGPGADADS